MSIEYHIDGCKAPNQTLQPAANKGINLIVNCRLICQQGIAGVRQQVGVMI